MWNFLNKYRKQKINGETVVVEDQRRMVRIRMLLTIICQSSEHPDPFRVMTENMNSLGIKFISPIELFPGEILDLNILLHSNFSNITVKGRVVWCEKRKTNGKSIFEGGVEFLTLSLHDKKFLEKFIDRHKVIDY